QRVPDREGLAEDPGPAGPDAHRLVGIRRRRPAGDAADHRHRRLRPGRPELHAGHVDLDAVPVRVGRRRGVRGARPRRPAAGRPGPPAVRPAGPVLGAGLVTCGLLVASLLSEARAGDGAVPAVAGPDAAALSLAAATVVPTTAPPGAPDP